MQKLPLTVLYVEDETVVLFSVTEMLRRKVENVLSAIDGNEGFELFKKHSPDVVITDINMPGMNGLQMARKIKQHNPDIHIYLLSAYPQPDYLLEAFDIGVEGFLKKPLDKEKLFSILEEISERILLKEKILLEEHEREKSEEKFRTLAENIPGTVYIYEMCKDGKTRIMHYLGPGFKEMVGKKFSKEINYDATSFFDYVHPDDYGGLQEAAEKALDNNESLSYEYRMKSSEGNIIWVRSICRGLNLENGNTLWQGVLINVSDLKKTEEQIKNNEAFSNALFEYNPVETIVVDKECKIVRFNHSIEEHRTRTPHIGYVMYKDYASKNKMDMFKILVDCIKNNERKVIPDSIYREGEISEKHFHVTITPFPEGAIINSRDITRQVHAEELLKKEIEQKELLIKEINHRVKNNFALVSSLLAIQQQNIEDEKVRDIFEEAQNRIQSIALVHKQLYSSENLAQIDFSTYINSLIRQLMGGFKHKTGQISIDLDIKGVALDIAKAIPCGLIINELITNSFKHGFQQRENGTITVKMQYLNDGNIQFIIANDGKPFPDNVDFRDTQTLGLQIVTGLVEQIGGTIELDNSKGTKFTIVFSK
ncbi:MAG: response regulator [Candidatus Celaenobacter antarcticus]|nr:response regulator [Candidatus Celaenobacter antarcticus]MDP8314371.1 response regulator [Candidatus Celaenobacter antarcticus]